MPRAQVAALLQSGAVGTLKALEARVLIPQWVFGGGDIRFNPKLAGMRGGVLMGEGWARAGWCPGLAVEANGA